MKRPSMAFTRRMCPNLFAFARCWQFQVCQKVTFVIRRKRQVQCVTTGISRYYFVPDISLDDLGDGRLDGQER